MIKALLILLLSAAAAKAQTPPTFGERAAEAVAARYGAGQFARLAFTKPAIAEAAGRLYGPDAQISVESFDPHTHRFALRIEAAQGAQAMPPTLLTGIATPLVSIPVLARDVKPGDVIRSADIVTQTLEPNRLPPGTVRTLQELEGLTPRYHLNANRPVTAQSLRRKPVILKGDAVSVRFVVGGLELSAAAQAMHDAGPGEPLQILNLRSKKTLDAVATAPGQAEIRNPI
ncbi:MAG TPA: flagella basal body P-ring formation protein FlgA [Alphaproteobacteria bacterium]|nr:flagella basal body P-ring formation protein FlgA [Alphaproteobacteria bacterium]HAJ48582.1 flagella basal body P-ring formation protein FlgA [Alphaproteobacteria bacterium]